MRSSLLLFVVLAACGPSPEPTGATCPDPDPGTLTWDNFGKPFMDKYCRWCHDSALPKSKRNGAPLYHDFDSLLDTLKVANHTDEQAGAGPDATNEFMPPDRCPSTPGAGLSVDCMKPTLAERKQLAEWLACEQKRPHNFNVDAGVDAP
jgi:hypothetical protein